MGLDREELLPKLLPLRGRGTGGVEPGSRPALGQAVAAPRPVESERSNFAADLRPCGQHAWRMLRKMRFEGPPSRLDELVDAARGAGLELDDYAIDTTGAYGWPMCGNGLAVVIVVIEDDEWAPEQMAAALRAAHERMAGTCRVDRVVVELDTTGAGSPPQVPSSTCLMGSNLSGTTTPLGLPR